MDIRLFISGVRIADNFGKCKRFFYVFVKYAGVAGRGKRQGVERARCGMEGVSGRGGAEEAFVCGGRAAAGCVGGVKRDAYLR